MIISGSKGKLKDSIVYDILKYYRKKDCIIIVRKGSEKVLLLPLNTKKIQKKKNKEKGFENIIILFANEELLPLKKDIADIIYIVTYKISLNRLKSLLSQLKTYLKYKGDLVLIFKSAPLLIYTNYLKLFSPFCKLYRLWEITHLLFSCNFTEIEQIKLESPFIWASIGTNIK